MSALTSISLVQKFYESFAQAAEKIFGKSNVLKKTINENDPFKDGALIIKLKSAETGPGASLRNDLFIHIMPWVDGEIRAAFNQCAIFDREMFERLLEAAQIAQENCGLSIRHDLESSYSQISIMLIKGFNADQCEKQAEHLAGALLQANTYVPPVSRENAARAYAP